MRIYVCKCLYIVQQQQTQSEGLALKLRNSPAYSLVLPLLYFHFRLTTSIFFHLARITKKRAEKQPGRPAAGRQAGKYATNSHSKHARKFLQFAGRSSVGFEFEGVLAMRCVAKCNRMRIENVQQRMA